MFTLLLPFFFLSHMASASWHYNSNGGFGFYQPEGWRAEVNGRSSLLERGVSSLFMGSDWVSSVKNLRDLEHYVRQETRANPRPIVVSTLSGFQTGDGAQGKIFVLRQEKNVMVVEFSFQSPERQEGQEILGSIEIRTKGIEYP